MFPAYLYFNTTWAGYLLELLLRYQQSSQYTETYAVPDLGPSYPSAAGNNNPSIFGAIEGICTSSGYPVSDSDPSLDDIAYVLHPTSTKSSLPPTPSQPPPTKPAYDLASNAYVPGYVGLNNIKHSGHMNVIIHALLHISPLRDALLLSPTNSKNGSELTRRFSALAKKLWNPRPFKPQVFLHEFLQEVNRASGGKFRLEQQDDPVDVPGWLLNHSHKDLGGTKKNSSIIFSTFQGQLCVDTQQVVVSGDGEAKPRFDIDREIKSTVSPFLFLSIDLPPPPLFQDAIEKNIIPSPVGLGKVRWKDSARVFVEYRISTSRRFTKNTFVEEKNPTIVNFPLNGLDLREYLSTPSPKPLLYDLVANVTHESVAGTT
ncbi:cysteine proteinase [Armillaria gallica]|uniref:Cysteine proteinase n=1 Tax=Armillaria gallica TaxID=47427 RepID=A0A2H3DYT4_ARMGA|nr:cysteine proteinase [Armillaria gallica]